MPYVEIAESPLLPGTRPIELFFRDVGPRDIGPRDGAPLLVLHGGWGYEFYPFDAQIAALPERRIVIPDRTGYGKSRRIAALPPRFHQAAAGEHAAMLDARGIERSARIAAMIAPSEWPQIAQRSMPSASSIAACSTAAAW